MDLIVVSIGTLSRNPFWGEKTAQRTSHATTTLVRSGAANVLVDPSLPANLLVPRLQERSGLNPAAITHVFLTNWRPVHRRALEAFAHARWWMNDAERSAAEQALGEAAGRIERGATEAAGLVRSEEALLKRVEAAPDELAEDVDLYPLAGYTPGQAGLLVATPALTTLIAGDAVPTQEHFLAGRVFEDCFDLATAKESLAEMFEIADVVVPGHDNLFVTPRQGGF